MSRGRQKPKAIDDLTTYPGRYVTSHQLADYFGVAHDTVNNWIRKGKLQACKPGGYDWRIQRRPGARARGHPLRST